MMHNGAGGPGQNHEYAHSVYLGGNIYTVDPLFSKATALACRGQQIIYVGDDSGAQALIGPQTQMVHLDGKTVLPGMIEGHMHLMPFAADSLKLQLQGKSKRQILDDVSKAASLLQPGAWLVGAMGWNNDLWADASYPTLAELDAAAPNNPVLLPRIDGHLIWVNTRAFELAGIDEHTPNPQGGEYMHTPDGKLQGCVSDTACEAIRALIPPLDSNGLYTALLNAQQKLFELGLTSVNDMMSDGPLLNALQALYQKQSYKIRFSGAVYTASEDTAAADAAAYLYPSPQIGLFDHRFNCRAVKIVADGSVGAQSAAHFEDFADRPGHKGKLLYTDEQLYKMVKDAAERGFQVIAHAIGDAAIDQVLRIYECVLNEVRLPDARFRLEHFQLVTGDSRERAKKLGVVASMQPLHAPNSAGMALRRLGPDRASRAYAMGLVLKVLGMVSAGSDCPVADPNPFWGMYAAVTRKNQYGQPEGGFFPEHCISRQDALKAYTIWNAFAQHTERQKGSLEAGKLADFIVVDRDVMACPDDDLLQVQVLQTVVGGETVYKRQG